METILSLIITISSVGVCVTVFWLLLKGINRPVSPTVPPPHPKPSVLEPLILHQQLPYARIPQLMTAAERDLYAVLRRAVPDNLLIFAQVRLANLAEVTSRGKQRKYDFYRIQAKCVDFVLCDAVTSAPMLVIELDDSSHQLQHRQERDAFVDAVLRQANIPILHINWQPAYRVDTLAEQILRQLGQSRPPYSVMPSPSSRAPAAAYAPRVANYPPAQEAYTATYRSPIATYTPPIEIHVPKMEMTYACGKCHQAVRREAQFCQHCGTVLHT